MSGPMTDSVRELDPAAMRSVLGRFATGVAVVTAATPEGPVGMTANSFTSVSLEPPVVLFCAAHSSRTYPHIQRAGAFAVNILSRTQEEVSNTFARKEEDDRFAEVGIETDVTGAPILSDSIAYLDCRMVDRIEHGDHVIVLGEVTAAGVQPGDSEPLLFFRGSYRRPAAS